jgi:ribosomal protein L4
LELTAPKTKLLIGKLQEFGLTRALILVEAFEEKLFLAARNVPYVDVLAVSALDPLSLIKHDKVLATVGALKLLDQRLGGTQEKLVRDAHAQPLETAHEKPAGDVHGQQSGGAHE